ncbi:MAG TPA: DUF502 domain-containing protein [Planctomycetota bacterium]
MNRPPLLRARRTALRFVVQSFLNGLLVLAPVGVTAWILVALFRAIDELLPLPDTVAPGIGFALVVGIVIAVGILTSNFLAAQALALSDRVLARVPFVKLVYSSIRDLTEAFVGQKKKFDRPVLLRLADELEVIGFVTRDDLEELGLSERIAVYVPQSYNFAANLVLVPRTRVRPLDKPAGEVMAFVVSGGLTSAGAG